MVYCPTNDALVQVTDRLSPVGLCCMLDSVTGLYLTADELFAVRHSTFFNYQFGFDVSIPSQEVFDQYSLPRQHTIQLSNGTQILYSRNFQLFSGGFNMRHQSLGYLHDSEITAVQAKDAEQLPANSRTPGPTRNLFGGQTPTPFTAGDTASLIDTGTSQISVQHRISEKLKLKYVELSNKAIQEHRKWKLLDTSEQYSIQVCTTPVAKTIDDLFLGKGFVTESGKYEWYSWTFADFYDKLLQCFKATKIDNVSTIKKAFYEQAQHDSVLDTTIQGWLDHSNIVTTILQNSGVLDSKGHFIAGSLTPTEQEELGHYVYKLMLVDSVQPGDTATPTPRRNFKEMLLRKFQAENPGVTQFPSVEVFMQYLLKMYNQRLNAVSDAMDYGMLGGQIPPPISEDTIEEIHNGSLKPRGNRGGGAKRPSEANTLNNIIQDDAAVPCNGCGWTGVCVDYANCHFKSHPGYNKDKNKSWAASNNGKAYKAAKCEDKHGKTAGRDQLSFYHRPCGKKMTEPEMKALKDAGMTKPKRLSKKPQSGSSSGGKRKLTDHPFDILATYTTTKDESYLRPFSVLCHQEKTKVERDSRSKKANAKEDNNIKVNALIDTGAIQSSYISLNLARKLHKLGLMKIQTKQRICSGINNSSCTTATASYDLTLSFVNERTLNEELLVLRAQVIDSRFDLIIGQPDIFFMI